MTTSGLARYCARCGAALNQSSRSDAVCPTCKVAVSIDADRCPSCRMEGPFYPADTNRALLIAIRNGDSGMVALLLNEGADVNHNFRPDHPNGFTPLDAAEASGHQQIVRLILNAGGVRAFPDQPLHAPPVGIRNAISVAVSAMRRRG